MEPDVREHIFEAFFTTKEATGTGLGLWVSQEIVLKHHGLMRVRSRVAAPSNTQKQGGSGTVFEIFLPDEVPSAAASDYSAGMGATSVGAAAVAADHIKA